MNKKEVATYSQLISGSPIPLAFFTVRQLTLREVAEIESEYNEGIAALMVQKKHLKSLGEQIEQFTDFEVFTILLMQDPDFAQAVQTGLDIFVEESLQVRQGLIYLDDQYVDQETWEKLQILIAQTNGLPIPEEEKFNPGNSKAEEMKSKFAAQRKRIEELKRKQGGENKETVFHMALKFSAKSPNSDLQTTLKLTIPQLIHSYKQLIHVSTQEDNFGMLLNGADSKKIKLSHWTELFKEE